MRRRLLPLLLLLVLTVGCASSQPDFGPGAIGEDVFPIESRDLTFVTTTGENRLLRMRPEAAGTLVITVEGDGIPVARMLTFRRHDQSIWVASGPGGGTELLRFGVEAGTTWESGVEVVSFDGWERVEVPAGVYDAARISTRRGSPQLARIDSWWFAPREGLVRFRSDQGGLVVEELRRVTPSAAD